MIAVFFNESSEGVYKIISKAKTSDPFREFRLLASGDTGDSFIFNTYGAVPPELPPTAVLGMGRNVKEAKKHIVLRASDLKEGV